MAPSGFMKAYQDVRREGEEYCLNKNLNCTFIRPWYVLGPGHGGRFSYYLYMGSQNLSLR